MTKLSYLLATATAVLATPAIANDGTSDASLSMAGPLLALTEFLDNTGGSLIIIASVIIGVGIWAVTQRAGAAMAAAGVGLFVGYAPQAITSLAGITAELPTVMPVVQLLQEAPEFDVTLSAAEYTPLDG